MNDKQTRKRAGNKRLASVESVISYIRRALSSLETKACSVISWLAENPFAVILPNQFNLCASDAAVESFRHIHTILNLRMDIARDMAEEHLDYQR